MPDESSLSKIRVFTFAPDWGLPTVGPFALKLLAWLELAGVPYVQVVEPNPRKGPKGKNPWIELDGEPIGDSEVIIALGWLRFFDQLIAERNRLHLATEKPHDLFDLLLAARDPETGKGFSQDEVRDQAATMILAGHETTALALSWALYLLALAPESQERVAGEIGRASLSSDGGPAFDRLDVHAGRA